MTALRVGVLADNAIKQAYLSDLVLRAGHQIATHWVVGELPLPDLDQHLDAWIVDLELSLVDAEFSDLLFEQERPVILSESHLHNPHELMDSERRLLHRLKCLSGDVNLQTKTSANEVWILAASTGGPAAVKDFVAALPPELNIAFVYVQHINSGQADTLAKMLNNAGHYATTVAAQGSVISNNSITVITAGSGVEILSNGTLNISHENWKGIYSPSIDQVAANIARVYKQNCGIIIFTGLGDDGAASCRLIKQQGGKVWAQSPEQCTSPSMPTEAIATNTVSFQGSPDELAEAFAQMKYQPVRMKQSSL